jgi:Lrp/AsnC family leucine-responsive transcriptional regulator
MASSFDFDRLMDATNWRIVQILQEEARISFAELGRRVNLSSPAVAERVERLEAAGIIEGYHARVNTAKVGYPIRAIIRVDTQGRDNVPRNTEMLQRMPEVLECHRITGPDCYYISIAAADMERLQCVIDQISTMGRTTTSMVLGSPVAHKVIQPACIEPCDEQPS